MIIFKNNLYYEGDFMKKEVSKGQGIGKVKEKYIFSPEEFLRNF